MNPYSYAELIEKDNPRIWDIIMMIIETDALSVESIQMNKRHVKELESMGEDKLADQLQKDLPYAFKLD